MATSESQTRLRVFSEIDRTEVRSKSETESSFTYLDKSARPMAAWARDLIEAWFSRYPPSAQREWRDRYRSDDDEEHESAFFELYCHELLVRAGFSIVVHPLAHLGGTSPDFLASKDGRSQFYLEATTVFRDGSDASGKARLGQVDAAVNALGLTDFFVGLSTIRYGQKTPSAAKVCKFIQQKVQQLDPDDLIARNHCESFRYEDTDSGWAADIQFFPKRPEARGPSDSTIGVRSPPMVFSQNSEAIKNALRKKANKYGELDLPLVIAVNCASSLVFDDEIPVALYGGGVTSTEIPERADRDAPGLWLGAAGFTYTRVSAVIAAKRMCPWTVPIDSPVTWHHPAAARAIAVDTFKTPAMTVDTATRKLQYHSGGSGATLFEVAAPPRD